MKQLTSRQWQALQDREATGVFIYADHPDGELYMWSGAGTISHGGREWIGIRGVLRIEGLNQELGFVQNEVRITLAYIPHSPMLDINTMIEGRRAFIYLAFLDEEQRVIDGLIPSMVFIMDSAILSVEPTDLGISMTYTALGRAGLVNLNLPSRLTWSSEDQRFLYPDANDTGFDEVYNLQNARIAWFEGPRR